MRMRYAIILAAAMTTALCTVPATAYTPDAEDDDAWRMDPQYTCLTDAQRLYAQWTEQHFRQVLNRSADANGPQATPTEREPVWLQMLDGLKGRDLCEPINGLAAIGSRDAVPQLLAIAVDRTEEDNRTRWMAVRALGLIGDESVVPDLIHLLYHYNQNTRFWAQISLARLTGVRLGPDWQAWGRWWNEQGGNPPFHAERVQWTTNPQWADPALQEESDQRFIEGLRSGDSGAADQASLPRIIRLEPADGVNDVDPLTTELVVEFDRDMQTGGYSWCGGGPAFPQTTGKPQWRSPRICVLPVQLEPHRAYALSINCPSARNFRSADGVAAEPHPYTFRTTGPASSGVTADDLVPQLVRTVPEDGAVDVDPGLMEITVEFDRDMGPGFSWCGAGPSFPATTDRPHWRTPRICVLPVQLEPDHSYAIGINCPSARNFRDSDGVPADPVPLTFHTAAESTGKGR